VRTSLAQHAEIVLTERPYADITTAIDFVLDSDEPIMLETCRPARTEQACARAQRRSSLGVPPYEQFRASYVFLTPDKYSFDFIRVIAPKSAAVVFDGQKIEEVLGCSVSPLPALPLYSGKPLIGELVVHRCQLSFPVIDPNKETDKLSPGLQNDGVHRIDSNQRVGVLVDGFDAYVSYGYAGGTELTEIVPR
jgi:hypothetical protein